MGDDGDTTGWRDWRIAYGFNIASGPHDRECRLLFHVRIEVLAGFKIHVYHRSAMVFLPSYLTHKQGDGILS